MLVEIPDLDVIFRVLVAFLVGLFAFYAYYKIIPYVNLKKRMDPSHLERLEYYERQLIDMKIRMDAMELGTDPEETSKEGAAAVVAATPGPPAPPVPAANEPAGQEGRVEVVPVTKSEPAAVPTQAQRMPNMAMNHAINHVLSLITDKSLTSRDIQITLGRSREHTSRLMKRLFEDGLVERNEGSKPYTYSITQLGRERIKDAGPAADPK